MSDINVERMRKILNLIDSGDFDAMGEFLDQDVVWRFANNPIINGREAVIESLNSFSDIIETYSHETLTIIADDDRVAFYGHTTYQTVNHGTHTFPGGAFLKFENGLVTDYKILVDLSPMLAEIG